MTAEPLPPVADAVRAAYDPEAFRAHGHRLIDALADQLRAWHAGEGRALPYAPPAEARAAWAAEDLGGGHDPVADLARIAAASTALAHPRCMAHQVPPPLPVAVLAEAVSALLNNGMAVYEMGPAAVPIELAVIAWMARTLGLASTAGGLLTSGGSLGNLTALLAMRQAHAGFDAWKHGAHGGPQLAVIVSSEAHYSVARTLRIMGWGEAGAIAAPVDADHRLRAASVEAALATAGDRRVIGVIAAAGSTATGAFDPLDELADVCAARGLWLHVDAAHGGGLAVSRDPARRALLAGIARADSVVWDAHKMLALPGLVTAVLFRAEHHAYEAFAQQASYLFEAAARPEDTWWDLGQRTLECTKRMMAIELWTALRTHGEAWFGANVDRLCDLAGALARTVAAAPDFELAGVSSRPTANIVCYRHVPRAGMTAVELDAHNRALRARVVADGRYYIVGTQLPGGYHLRSTLMNPLTEAADIAGLLAHLRVI